jgi:mannose-6-phosphate isomerase-like protein (cupin superfamily)
VIVPAGARHNVINISTEKPLRLYTIYSPPHHPDGTVEQTKEAAETNEAHV